MSSDLKKMLDLMVTVNGKPYNWTGVGIDPNQIDLDDPDQTREYQLTQAEIDALFSDFEKEFKKVTEPVCECGGLKTNTGHSTWCPAFKPYK